MKKIIPVLLVLLFSFSVFAQIDLPYQTPPQEIMNLADVSLAPSMRIDDEGKNIVLLYRNQYKSISELSQPEMRLAGLRINPKTNISSRKTYYTNISVMRVGEKKETKVKGLPSNPQLSNFTWSPDKKFMAFNQTTKNGIELWVLNIEEVSAKKLTSDNLNANLGKPFVWSKSSNELLIKQLPIDRQKLINKTDAIPTGPRVSVNEGQEAQNRTYQDLLQDKVDETNFEQLARSTLATVNLNGEIKPWKEAMMYRSTTFSPDGNYILISYIEKPFSYLVPYYKFPTTYDVYTKDGKKIKTIEKVPLTEEVPKGFMSVRMGKRSIDWRSDKPSMLTFAIALDEGNAEKKVDFRDEVFIWDAPFDKKPQSLVKTINRYSYIVWGNDKLALVYEYWWNTRNIKAYFINPSDPSEKRNVIQDRNYQDRYNNPGSPISVKNEFGEYILLIENNSIYLEGPGHSPEGIFPFIDKLNIKTKETKRIWQAQDKHKLEKITFAIDIQKGKILTRIEAKNEYPNYYIRDIREKDKKEAITFFKNPFASLENIYKEVITYNREDGVKLSATLYLPVGYDKSKKQKLPMLMWAYPYEFKDKASAGQVTSSPNEFTYPWYGSPIFWVQRGFAVLEDASFPIIGEDQEEPNDTFMKQLIGNAKAAIDAVAQMGYIDRNRVAIGGHSYGAFMTANLLTHSNLFAAGIARSGAYNRTLTPFGFQSEERNYWEAPQIYYNMSPFMHANKMKGNLLLIHGAADNNSGTYPMQSERYFNALKGLGANVRLVMLPKESHGYRSRESVLHVLWEQDQWLMKYVKNKKSEK